MTRTLLNIKVSRKLVSETITYTFIAFNGVPKFTFTTFCHFKSPLRDDDLSKQELMSLLKISGQQLNLLLGKLEKESQIVIKKVTKGKGKPQERVFLSK